MGLFDHVAVSAALSLPGLDRDPSTIDWQTKSIGQPCMRSFRITAEGRLLQEERETKRVPPEERPYHESDEWDEPEYRAFGSIRHEHRGWSRREYHGIVRLVASTEDDFLEYRLKFTDGRLVAARETSDDSDGEWLPIDSPNTSEPTRSSLTSSESPAESEPGGSHPGPIRPAYKRTATRSIVDLAKTHDISLPTERLTDRPSEGRYVQVIALPDDREPETPVDQWTPMELLVREPPAVNDSAVDDSAGVDDPGTTDTGDTRSAGYQGPTSEVLDRYGPFEARGAIDRALDIATNRGLTIAHEIVQLRPTHWTDSSLWTACPTCESGAVTLVTDLDDSTLTLACRDCDDRVSASDDRVSASDDRDRLFHEWLHCPACGSGDVDIEISAPGGRSWWSCDDCLYDTVPAPIDRGYSRYRRE